MRIQEVLPVAAMAITTGGLYIAYAERLPAQARGWGLPEWLASPQVPRRFGIASVLFGLAVLLLPVVR